MRRSIGSGVSSGGNLLRRLELQLLAAGESMALAERPAVDEHRPRVEQPFCHTA